MQADAGCGTIERKRITRKDESAIMFEEAVITNNCTLPYLRCAHTLSAMAARPAHTHTHTHGELHVRNAFCGGGDRRLPPPFGSAGDVMRGIQFTSFEK